MTVLAMPLPVIDPVAISLGPLAIRWYALAYVAGLVLGWRLMIVLARHTPHSPTQRQIDDYLTWVTLGVILGGRLGYILFYNAPYYLSHPGAILEVWQGGMAFHGGMLGVILASAWFAKRHKLSLFRLGDLCACTVPIGLFLGRIANFINGELYGRVAPHVSWAMVFPGGGPEPRHPSQLYQAGMEGLLLGVVMLLLWRARWFRDTPGRLAGAFLIGYGIARLVGEIFRQPDAHLGFIVGPVTMGQLLSVPMVLAGLWFVLRKPKTS